MEDKLKALAKRMWSAYAVAAGGKSFDGKPLPDWDGLGADRQACWMAAAAVAREHPADIELVRLPDPGLAAELEG